MTHMAGEIKSINIQTKEVHKGHASDSVSVVEENAQNAPVKDIDWQATQLTTESDTKVEDDQGTGDPLVLRIFEFGINPEAFKQHKPTKQELFNSHYRQIEIALWADGMQVVPEIDPRVVISKKKQKYRIFVGARAARGQMFSYKDTPQTLKQVIHGGKRD